MRLMLFVLSWALVVQAVHAELVASPALVDAGEVRSGPPKQCLLNLKNRSSKTITIDSIQSVCGCGQFQVDSKVVSPDQSARLTVVINTLTQPAGNHLWKVRVTYRTSGESEVKTLECSIQAKIIQEISVEPPVLAITTSSEAQQTIKVIDRREKPLTIRHVSSSIPGLKLEIIEGSRVRLEVPSSLAAGQHEDHLLLQTDDSTCPELRVPIKITKRRGDDLTLIPEAPRIFLNAGQSEGSTLVQLRAGGKPVAIANAETRHPGITVRFSDQTGIAAGIRIIIDRKAAGANGQAEIQLKCKVPADARLTIPITWTSPE